MIATIKISTFKSEDLEQNYSNYDLFAKKLKINKSGFISRKNSEILFVNHNTRNEFSQNDYLFEIEKNKSNLF